MRHGSTTGVSHAVLDHLVVAAADLEQGSAWLRETLGAEPAGGGRHDGRGTHNRLLRLGAERYLEVIAVDPDAPAPEHPRWFELDSPALQAAITGRPRLVTWVARCDDLDALTGASPVPLGEVRDMRRGDLRWRMTVTPGGMLLEGGLLPPLIEWRTAPHPAAGLPDAGCELIALEGSHPDPQRLRGLLEALGLAGEIRLSASPGEGLIRLRARVRTPQGERLLGG